MSEIVFMSSKDISDAIHGTRAFGEFFSCAFFRRTSRKAKDARAEQKRGDIRLYRRAKLGVKKYLKTEDGSGAAYNFSEKKLICCFVFPDRAQDDPSDPEYRGDYRTIDETAILFARVSGKTLVSVEGLARLLESSGTVEKAEADAIEALKGDDDAPDGFVARSAQGIGKLRDILKEHAISV
jgi:hypothetical protein